MPKRSPSTPAPSKVDQLTAREREVFLLISEGLTTAQISQRIRRSPKTVESHRLSIGRKLGVSNRVQLARVAIECGMSPISAPLASAQYNELRTQASRVAAAEAALRKIDAAVGAVAGQDFFDTLAAGFAHSIPARSCFIATLRGDSTRILAASPAVDPASARLPANLSLTRNLPRGEVLSLAAPHPLCQSLAGVLAFPVAAILAAPLFDSLGRWVGDMVLAHDTTISTSHHPDHLLRIFSIRAGAEIERKTVEDELIHVRNLLEERVADRTHELNETNRRLAASYEVLKSTLDSLAQQQHWLRDMFDYSPSVVFAKDLEGRYIAVNRRFSELFKISREDAQGKTDYQIFDTAHADAFRELDAQVIRERRAIEADEIAPHDDGPHNYFVTKFPLYDASGKIYGVCGIATDVTDRTREENLREDFNAVLEKIAVGSDLPEMLEDITLAVERSRPGLLCSILLLDPDGIHLRLGAAPSLPAQYNNAVDGIAIGPNVGSCGSAAASRTRIIVTDISSDPRWSDFTDIALAHNLRACWSQPILCTEGNVLGTFAMYYSTPRGPGENDIELIEQAARLARIAIDHDKLNRSLRALAAPPSTPARAPTRR